MLKALLLVAASSLVVLGYDCPPGTLVGSNGQCYYASRQQQTWVNATTECNSMGGQLALPRNAFDNSILTTVLRTTNIVITWLGTYSDMGGVWYDQRGFRLNYTNWEGGQPEQSNTYGILVSTGGWRTFQKGGYSDFVCQIPSSIAPTAYPGNSTVYPTYYPGNGTVHPTVYPGNGTAYPTVFPGNGTAFPGNGTAYPTMFPGNGTNYTPLPNGTNPDPYNMTAIFQQLSLLLLKKN